MRETYRLQKNKLLDQMAKNHRCVAVFFIYTGKELPEYKDVFEKTATALQGLIDSIKAPNP